MLKTAIFSIFFLLLTLIPVTSAQTPTEMYGIYRSESGDLVGIYDTTDFFDGAGMFVDYSTGAMRLMEAAGEGEFVAGPSLGVSSPASYTLSLAGDQLTWQGDSEPQSATRLEFTQEIVSFESDGGSTGEPATLVGELLIPTDSGAHPAIVFLHGFGQATRRDYYTDTMAYFFASQGFAVLRYDKRGVDESTGTYNGRTENSPENIERLASDVRAGADYLSTRSEIDAERIGLWGLSQSGWIAPLAAEQSDLIDFMILTSGTVVTTSKLRDFITLTGGGRTPREMTEEQLNERLAALPATGFDPVPSLEQLTIPSLWLYGDLDNTVPVTESMANLELLRTEHNQDITIVQFESTDHGLKQSQYGMVTEVDDSPGFPDGYFQTISDWLLAKVLSE